MISTIFQQRTILSKFADRGRGTQRYTIRASHHNVSSFRMTSQCTRIMFQRQTRQMLHRVRICVGLLGE